MQAEYKEGDSSFVAEAQMFLKMLNNTRPCDSYPLPAHLELAAQLQASAAPLVELSDGGQRQVFVGASNLLGELLWYCHKQQ